MKEQRGRLDYEYLEMFSDGNVKYCWQQNAFDTYNARYYNRYYGGYCACKSYVGNDIGNNGRI